MKRASLKILSFFSIALIANVITPVLRGQQVSVGPTSGVAERVEWLLAHLTLDEKLSLLVHQNPAIERVGLPAYSWWNEALHGYARAGIATVYPMPIALAATFHPELVQPLFANVAAEAPFKHREMADTGYYGDNSGLTFFTPNINIFRDPRWGRGMETYGEDPYLTARMGLACVEGLQGGGTAACLKHLAVHSGPEGVRHEFNSIIDDRNLRTTYLPAFEYIIKHSPVAQVMCGYNRINGAPCCTNRRLFDILRKEWCYNGILVTDCWALNDAYETDTVIPRHRTHATAAAAYGDAFGYEVDLECGSGLPALREAVQQGLITESKVDEHLRRVLRVRLQVERGKDARENDLSTVRREGNALALQAARESMVLLKNNGVLPLKGSEGVRLDGPNVWDTLMPLGNYNGFPEHCVSIGEAMKGGNGHGRVTVYVGGLSPQLEGEELQVEQEGFYRGDRTRIELPKEQVADIKALKEQGGKVVLVICNGSAIALEDVIDYCDAVLVAWYGGQNMGTAVKQLLYGEQDDFGHLPLTFYRSTDQLPPFEDYDMQRHTYRYLDDEAPLFPFGYGLSYSFYQLYETRADEATFTVSGIVSQCNTDVPDACTHRAVVQVYLRNDSDPEGPVKQLVGMQSVSFDMGDPQTRKPFNIALDPFWFRQFNPDSGMMEEPADGTPFTLQVGFSSADRDLIDLPFIYHNRK